MTTSCLPNLRFLGTESGFLPFWMQELSSTIIPSITYLVTQNQSRLASETWHAVSVLGILVPRIDLQIQAETHSEDQFFQASTLSYHVLVAWQSRFTNDLLSAHACCIGEAHNRTRSCKLRVFGFKSVNALDTRYEVLIPTTSKSGEPGWGKSHDFANEIRKAPSPGHPVIINNGLVSNYRV